MSTLKHSINAQRALLNDLLSKELVKIAENILPLMDDQERLDQYLQDVFNTLKHCKYMYVLDNEGVQITANINRYGADQDSFGRDRSSRPYMSHMSDNETDFKLSEAYISRNKKRPSVTALQTIRDELGNKVGFLGVDYDLRELPHSDVMYEEPRQWRQIKGDPAIRSGLFTQSRVNSLMDERIDDVLSLHEALVVDQGVHHFQIHFSSSRTTIWHTDDPYVYRILTMEELANTDICLAYPRRPYFKRAIVPQAKIPKILQLFKALRFADETIYLRSGSLNIVNGKIGLNFSCDGTHYLDYDEFIDKGIDFWFGGEGFPQMNVAAIESTPEMNFGLLDTLIEELAGMGCMQVNKLLYALERGETPEKLVDYSVDERDYVYQELKSVMDVYEGQVCGI